MTDPPATSRASCDRCGTSAAELPASWSLQVAAGGRTWLCDRCTRGHLRSIEAKLDDAWW